MKCGYCGKHLDGTGNYCGERCRKLGEPLARFAVRTRIPFWIFMMLAGMGLLVGCILLFTGNLSYAFVTIGSSSALAGLTLVALPRGGRGKNLACQIFGGVLFALGLLCVLFWH